MNSGTLITLCCLGMMMMSCVGMYVAIRHQEESVLDAIQAKKDKQDRQEKLLAALGDVKSIEAQTIEVVNDQALNIQEVYVYDKMENNLVEGETTVITGGYDTAKVSIDLGSPNQIPSVVIVNNKDSGGVIGASFRLLDESGKVIHVSKPIKDVADAYEYDPNFKAWSKMSFVKVGRNEDGTKFS